MSGISLFTTLLCLLALPQLLTWSYSDFFILLKPQFQGILRFLYPWQLTLIYFNLFCLAVYASLLIATQQLQAGRAIWHQIAFAEISIGVINGLLLTLEIAILVINIVAWIVVIVVVISVLFRALASIGK